MAGSRRRTSWSLAGSSGALRPGATVAPGAGGSSASVTPAIISVGPLAPWMCEPFAGGEMFVDSGVNVLSIFEPLSGIWGPTEYLSSASEVTVASSTR